MCSEWPKDLQILRPEGAASGIAISCLREAAQRHEKSSAALLDRAVHESDVRIGARVVKSQDVPRM